MTYGHRTRASQRRQGQRLWSLVAALWVAIGFSPCALAAVGDLDCLHCPTDAVSGHADHAMHGETAGEDHEHQAAGHASTASDCGDDCGDGGETLVDARHFKSSTKDAGDGASAIAVVECATAISVAEAYRGVDPPLASPVPRARLHAIHCVYLD